MRYSKQENSTMRHYIVYYHRNPNGYNPDIKTGGWAWLMIQAKSRNAALEQAHAKLGNRKQAYNAVLWADNS
jgi:hypothetical protein